MSPEQVAVLLNDYLTHMTRIVLDHGGTVDKFIGDAIMAFWGAPLPDPDQAWHACQAVRKMQARLAELRQGYQTAGLPRLRMRVGVHSGMAVVGNMGSADRFDYTAIGDNVNLASRLEGINKLYGTDILISGDTARMLGERLPLRRVDRVIVKGRTQPIDVFTFCENREIALLGEAALRCYMQTDWDGAASALRQILALDPQDGIGALFLKRIEEYRVSPPPDGWNGSIALEKL
jgi:adenylate cyclase